jgi:hypothetical protein
MKRVLVTHDADFLDDHRFPHYRCAGLLVLPTFRRQSMVFASLVAASTRAVHKGDDLWLHTKIVASKDFILTVRTWGKDAGGVERFSFDVSSKRRRWTS